jgi:tetratricopeptide (TPR) repeat protein
VESSDLPLVVLSGLIYGCYSREVVPENKNIYGQDLKPNPLSQEEIRKFTGSIRMVDGEAEAHYRLALHFQEKYRHKLAIDELKQALQRNPAHFKAYNALGVSFDNLGDHEPRSTPTSVLCRSIPSWITSTTTSATPTC